MKFYGRYWPFGVFSRNIEIVWDSYIEKIKKKSPKNFNSSPLASIFLPFFVNPGLWGYKQNLCIRFFHVDPFWAHFTLIFAPNHNIRYFWPKRIKMEKSKNQKKNQKNKLCSCTKAPVSCRKSRQLRQRVRSWNFYQHFFLQNDFSISPHHNDRNFDMYEKGRGGKFRSI